MRNQEKKKPVIRESIVVEGRDDSAAVLSVVEANTIITNGFKLRRPVLQRIRDSAAHEGILILTDPDFAGEQIRRRIEKELPGCRILHARIVREDAVRDGDIGVENASGSVILEAILKAGATILGQSEELPAEKSMSERDMLSAEETPTVKEKPFEEEPSTEERTTEEERMSAEGGMTTRDMLEFGLAGDGSKQRRTSLGRRLGIGYANAGQFLHRLRVRHIGRDEVKELLERGHGKYDGR